MRTLALAAVALVMAPALAAAQPVSSPSGAGPDTYLELHGGAYVPQHDDVDALDTGYATVEFSYVLRDGRTGDVLWEDRERMVYQSGEGGAGLMGAIINAAVTRASPSYMPLARQANAKALAFPGPGFPAGPYRPEYRQDWQPQPAGR